MPAAIPIITAIVSAAGVGTSIYEGKQSSDQAAAAQAQNKALLQQQQQAQANQANLTKQEAVLGSQGQTQAQTGGSLTDSGTAALTNLLAGYPGFQGGSASPVPAVSGTGGSGAPSAVSAILSALQNGGGGEGFGSGGFGGTSLSGGNWQTPPTFPQRQQQLSDSVL